MEKNFFKISWVGPIKAESCSSVKPYPVRQIVLQEDEALGGETFFGTCSNDDALMNLEKGDFVAVEMHFYARRHKGEYQQHVNFSNLKKLKEIKK